MNQLTYSLGDKLKGFNKEVIMSKGKRGNTKALMNARDARYSKEEREALRYRIWQLRQGGHTNEEIASIMTSEGYRTATKKPLLDYHIANQIQAMRKIEENKRDWREKKNAAGVVKEIKVKAVKRESAAKPKKEVEDAMVIAVLTSDKTNDTKVDILKLYYGI